MENRIFSIFRFHCFQNVQDLAKRTGLPMPALFVLLSVTGGMLGGLLAMAAGLGPAHVLAAYVLGGLLSAGSGCVLALRRS
jgi:hypothetical protein